MTFSKPLQLNLHLRVKSITRNATIKKGISVSATTLKGNRSFTSEIPMPSLLWYGDEAFWVSNAVKDLLYEAAAELANRDNPAAQQLLAEAGGLIGCYEVSGVGFGLE